MGRHIQDLINYESGHLKVIRFAGLYNYAAQKSAHWVCHCRLCNSESILPRKKLVSKGKGVKFDRCQACRIGHCIVCGTKIGAGNVGQLTCSITCLRLHDNYRSKFHHSDKAALDKQYHSRRWGRHKMLNPSKFKNEKS